MEDDKGGEWMDGEQEGCRRVEGSSNTPVVKGVPRSSCLLFVRLKEGESMK